MKFWLIVFFLNPQGEFLYKQEVQYESKVECQNVRAKQRAPIGKRIETYCVSDNHYRGISQDPGVPLD